MEDFERELSKEAVFAAAHTLLNLQAAFTALKMANEEQQHKSSEAGLTCVFAGLLALELANHLNDGKELYEALRATVRGEMKWPEEMSKELEKLTKRIRDPMRHN